MNAVIRNGISSVVGLALCVSLVAGGSDLRDSLWAENIVGVRINLNSWGGHLGFETEVAGVDPRVEALAAVIRAAEPARGHRCANSGAIRFRMIDGSVVGVGLLPSHTDGYYGLRLYEGDQLVAVYRVERAVLLTALENLGVPLDGPAFKE